MPETNTDTLHPSITDQIMNKHCNFEIHKVEEVKNCGLSKNSKAPFTGSNSRPISLLDRIRYYFKLTDFQHAYKDGIQQARHLHR